MRIGIYGGSFDPIHVGHLLLAETCRESLNLHTLLFVPSATGPLKPRGPVASNEDRVAMLRLALAESSMDVNTCEIDRGGVSYTLDTVSSIRAAHPNDELFLLMGADLISQLDAWHEPARVFSIATPAVLNRGAYPLETTRLRELTAHGGKEPVFLEMPQIELSSSEIRERVRTDRSILYRTPRSVRNYIRDQGLYREISASVKDV